MTPLRRATTLIIQFELGLTLNCLEDEVEFDIFDGRRWRNKYKVTHAIMATGNHYYILAFDQDSIPELSNISIISAVTLESIPGSIKPMANDHWQSDHQIRMLCLQKCTSNDIDE